ncbi:hypothetical protein ACTMTU_11760 [Streptomyces sp. OZ13]|uniref:hypothetical protein n=1 Tax=Streptomyces sp. OZ13 TaxID=3452210 RepID=UPI003F886355
MAGLDDTGGQKPAGSGAEGADESELRVLLERAVPRLPAPTERMQRVRERVARRRRSRRAAGGAACAVSALIVAGTLLPGAGQGGGSALPAASAPFPPSSSAPHLVKLRFDGPAGLVLPLPSSWDVLEVEADPRQKATTRGYAATQPLSTYDRPCSRDPWGCPPVKTLKGGGALLVVTAEHPGPLGKKALEPPVLHESGTVSPGCRAIGGVQELSGLIGGPGAGDPLATAHLCLAEDAGGALSEARHMIAGARFVPTGADTGPTPPAPGSTPGQDGDHAQPED